MTVRVVERVIEGDGFCVGDFWCPPDSPLWRTENTIERGPVVALPMTGVEIQHPDQRPIVTSSTRAMFYNRRQAYRRHLLHRAGDRCLFIGLDPRIVHEVLEANDAARTDDWDRPFEWTWGPLNPRLHLRGIELYRRLAAGTQPADRIYEDMLALLDALVGDASELHDRRAPSPMVVGRRALDAVDETLRCLVNHHDRSLTLAELGRQVDLSPFHLARSFRASTGMSLHECRDRIRVMNALNRLDSNERLIDIAMDAGYSSHSHLTQAFRRVLRETPSRLRKRLFGQTHSNRARGRASAAHDAAVRQ